MVFQLGRRASTTVLWWTLVLAVFGATTTRDVGGTISLGGPAAWAAVRPVGRVTAAKAGARREADASAGRLPGKATKTLTATKPHKPHSTPVTRTVRQVGRTVDFAAKRLERAGRRSGYAAVQTFTRRLGKALSLFFGEQTLVSMSFRGGVGVGLAFPGWAKVIGGVGGAVNWWTGSVAYYEDHVPAHGRTMHLNAGVGLSTLLYAISIDRRREVSQSIGLSVFSGSVSRRRFAISSGIPLLFGVALGEEQGISDVDFDKGPFLRVSSLVVPFINMSAEIYYRPLGPITKKLRPLARRARDMNERLETWFDKNLRPSWWPKAPPASPTEVKEIREEQPLGPAS